MYECVGTVFGTECRGFKSLQPHRLGFRGRQGTPRVSPVPFDARGIHDGVHVRARGFSVHDMNSSERSTRTRRTLLRWLVHVSLIGSVILSLVLEPVLTLHVVFGVVFVLLVACRLVQRRRISKRLAVRLLKVRSYLLPGSRLALADGFLLIITSAMLISGFWDLWAPHHTKIRWHAITGVLLTVFLVVHTLRRWRRLRFSQIR
jgi:hypothetical protein